MNQLTGAGLVRLVCIAAVVAVAANADGSSFRCGAAVGWTLQTQTWTLSGLKGTWWAGCRKNRKERILGQATKETNLCFLFFLQAVYVVYIIFRTVPSSQAN